MFNECVRACGRDYRNDARKATVYVDVHICVAFDYELLCLNCGRKTRYILWCAKGGMDEIICILADCFV